MSNEMDINEEPRQPVCGIAEPKLVHSISYLESKDQILEIRDDVISVLNKCQTKDAKSLSIYDVFDKLKQENDYDIGGTYDEKEPEFWFYYTTSLCPGPIFLLNVFVCYRKRGDFAIGISNSHQFKWHRFNAAQENENFYLATLSFTDDSLKSLQKRILMIPISIELNPSWIVSQEVIQSIKISHDLGKLLNNKESTDFVLESVSRKQYPIHKIFLAAHSPVLRSLVKNTTAPSLFIDISDNDMELLLQFIYTGTIKDIFKTDHLKLLELAQRFQLKNLFTLTQFAMGEQINVKNAIELALIAEKYNLEELQQKIFSFIKNNPSVMQTEGWKNLRNADLAKKLFYYVNAKN